MIKKEIKCPQCGHLTFYSLENPYRPFCSERCRLIDLGEWASESYKVSHTSNDNDHDNLEEDEEPSSTPPNNDSSDD